MRDEKYMAMAIELAKEGIWLYRSELVVGR